MRVVGLGSLVICAAVGLAHADPDTVHPGPQGAPPVQAGEPVLSQQLDGRRAVRGCTVGDTCTAPGEVMKEIDVELFPRPGGSPWVDEHTSAPSRLEPGPVRTVVKPSELRPDQPWLDQLELPDLPVRWSQKLVDYLVFYKNDPRGRAIISGWLVDQGRYKDLITSYLRKAKLPQDLLYVAMIESSYDNTTLSSAGALGLWQFMPEGGKIYGLRQDRWVDERRDPFRSTIAQMDYFADLYQRFGDWHIALAAFNVGYGAMLRSIARYNTNDYYKLCEYENAVPWETCLYSPKVLATAIVGHNRALYGMDKLKVLPAESWEDVSVPTSMSLAVIARAAGVSENDVKRLNPHLRRGRTPPGEPGYVVRVPVGTKVEAQRRIVELQTEWDNYDAYVVAHGERFEDVATTFGISTSALRKLNGVEHESEITGGTVLVVPRISPEQRAKNQAKARSKLLGSGIDQKDGEALIVPVPDKDFIALGQQRVFYRVVTGDSLRTIAKAFGVSADQLKAWNGLDDDANLHPKMVLVAWVAPTFDADKHKIALLDDTQLVVVTRGSPEHLDLAESRTGRVRVEYVAQGKEKLSEIAKRYGMGSHDLARINRISYETVLAKGDKIIVYQVSDPSRSKRADEQWRKTPRARRGKVSGQRAQTTASAKRTADDDDGDDDDAADAKAAVTDDDQQPDSKSDSKADDKKAGDKKAGDKKAGDKKAGDKKADKKSEPEAKAKKSEPEAKKPEPEAKKSEPEAKARKSEPEAKAKKSEPEAKAKKSEPEAKAKKTAPEAKKAEPVTRPTQVD
ncbi:MAG: LysM peptidoglycan-binding domain-containing protein [Myxococcales bacterium]|nr:LysM peptidoglycan-binding domain-containing protein [Myxococcales bacterium]